MRARLLAALALAWACAAQAGPGYFRFPSLSGDTLVFTAEGDLWRVAAAGGRASRLTTHPDQEIRAAISPDGRQVAFTGAYEGPLEAYVMPLAGGLPKRLTWAGGPAFVAGWTPAGEVLFTTPAYQATRERQLAAVSPESGAVRLLPLAQASDGAYLDRETVAFTRFGLQGDNVRRYRGGAMASLWRFSPGKGAEAAPLGPAVPEANESSPLPWGSRIVFVSDRDGVANLWSRDAGGGDLRQHTRHADFEVREPSISGSRVAYRHGADLRIVDLDTGADRVVPIELASDFDQLRTRWVRKPLENFTSAALSPDGERVVVTARGRVATAGVGPLRRVDIAVPAGSRAREAVMMPGGKEVLSLCDAGGEYELWLFPADGSGPGRMITRGAQALRWRAWPSPDGKWIVHYDIRRRLWLHEVAAGKDTLLEEGAATDDQAFDQVAWSPDASAFALKVESPGNATTSQVVLYRVADRARFPVTSTRYASGWPAFSPDGKWLWFVSERHFAALNGNPWGDRNMGPYFDRRSRVYAIALQPGNRFPFQPKDELAPAKPEASKDAPADDPAANKDAMKGAKPERGARPPAAPKIPPIAWEGVAARLHEAPLPPGNYAALATDGKRLWFLEAETAPERKTALRSIAIDNAGAPAETFAPEVRQFALSADGKKLMWRKWAARGAGEIHIADTAAKAPTELARHLVKLSDWQFPSSPREDWNQYFADAWRFHRDHFHDPAMAGADWPAARRKYGALLGRVTDRAELADLMGQMAAELSSLHSQVGRGEVRKGDEDVEPATLGATLLRVAEGARIERIHRADPELPGEAPPLSRPGVDAREGDVIVSVDGRAVAEVADISLLLRDKAGKQVLLGLKGADGKLRKAVAVPAPWTRAMAFRRGDREWERRRRVEEASGGRFGYVALRAMGAADVATFAREFYPVAGREGLVIDLRDNDGGNIDSIVIEKLLRRAWAYWSTRDGRLAWNMQNAFRGRIVVLVNERTYSDGETFAEGVKRLGLATVVGRRTTGAGVWLSDRNRLADGGIARSAELAQMGLEGAWLIEGRGVAPDVEVDNPPHATFRGEDAQLAAAIRVLEEALARDPVREPKVPPRPTPGRR
ncbi:MAG: PD40 domain-containing protein [Burkholderiales bacterium]|nr:PD40 domain-containing protein [Burkholderiales bacterium]